MRCECCGRQDEFDKLLLVQEDVQRELVCSLCFTWSLVVLRRRTEQHIAFITGCEFLDWDEIGLILRRDSV